jgi:hypothetical protein
VTEHHRTFDYVRADAPVGVIVDVAASDAHGVELDPDVVGAEPRRKVDIPEGKGPLPFENKRAHEFILDSGS